MPPLDLGLAGVALGCRVHDVQLVVVRLDQGVDGVEEAEGVLLRVLQGQDVRGQVVRVAGVALQVVRGPVGGGAYDRGEMKKNSLKARLIYF